MSKIVIWHFAMNVYLIMCSISSGFMCKTLDSIGSPILFSFSTVETKFSDKPVQRITVICERQKSAKTSIVLERNVLHY